MKRVISIVLMSMLCLGVVGCSTNTTWKIIEGNGYSFEAGESWPKENLDDSSYYLYPEGKGEGRSSVHISEYDMSTCPCEAFADQEEYLEKSLKPLYFDNWLLCSHENIKKGKIGSNAFVESTVILYTNDNKPQSKGREIAFFVNPKLRVTLSYVTPVAQFDRRQSEINRVIDSVELL